MDTTDVRPAPDRHWICTWAASQQGPYPSGSPIAQPDLRPAIPTPELGLRDQSLRMIVRPAVWSSRMRVRFANLFGDRPIRIGAAGLGLHLGGGAMVPGTWRGATFQGAPDAQIAPGAWCWSDPVDLDWAAGTAATALRGHTLAVSGHVEGVSGPLGWHAKAMTTSYLSSPGSAVSSDPTEAGFPHATTSWFLLDAVDAWCNTDHRTVVAFGDSLTDGTHTTLNGHDRWPDVLQRRLMHAGHPEIAVVNAGIGGNRIAGPAPGVPWRGGEAGATRLVRDVIGLSGVTAVIWLEGINDFTETADADVGEVLAALKQGVSRLRQSGLVVWGATVPSALHARRDGHGGVIQDRRRRAINDALRHEAIFDHLIDVDAVLTDPVDGTLDRSCDLDSTTGGPGDGLHPGRTGHARIAGAIDIDRLARVTRPQSSR